MSEDAVDLGKCQGQTTDRWGGACPYPAKAEYGGQRLCGRHLAGAKRAAANRERWNQKWAEGQREREQFQLHVQRLEMYAVDLSERLGAPVAPYLGPSLPGTVDRYMVSGEFLEAVAREREQRKARPTEDAGPRAEKETA